MPRSNTAGPRTLATRLMRHLHAPGEQSVCLRSSSCRPPPRWARPPARESRPRKFSLRHGNNPSRGPHGSPGPALRAGTRLGERGPPCEGSVSPRCPARSFGRSRAGEAGRHTPPVMRTSSHRKKPGRPVDGAVRSSVRTGSTWRRSGAAEAAPSASRRPPASRSIGPVLARRAAGAQSPRRLRRTRGGQAPRRPALARSMPEDPHARRATTGEPPR